MTKDYTIIIVVNVNKAINDVTYLFESMKSIIYKSIYIQSVEYTIQEQELTVAEIHKFMVTEEHLT